MMMPLFVFQLLLIHCHSGKWLSKQKLIEHIIIRDVIKKGGFARRRKKKVQHHMIRWNVRGDSMWGSKVIKFQACFNYIWKQLLSTWLLNFFSPFIVQLFIVLFTQLEKTKMNRPTNGFYCSLELTVQMHSMKMKKKEEKRVTYIRIKSAIYKLM